jgi:hypothetical protein
LISIGEALRKHNIQGFVCESTDTKVLFSLDTFLDLPGYCTLVLVANVWNSRWVGAELSNLPYAA